MTAKERPILFSGDMVRAILDGRKTMTRRVVKIAQHPQAERVQHFEGLRWDWLRYDGLRLSTFKCPFGKTGDRLWVRETFRLSDPNDCACYEPCRCRSGQPMYRADGHYHDMEYKWKPSIYMPRWSSRITLEITDIRVERLQDISEDDADSECFGGDIPGNIFPDLFPGNFDAWGHLSIPECFGRVWDAINGQGSWSANPWVWVLEFKRLAP